MRSFDSLSEREVLALAISLEEEDGRIYGDFAESLKEAFPATAEVFSGMRQEEIEHHARLVAMFRERFGEHIPLVRKQDVKGFVKRRPVWLSKGLGVETMRRTAESLECETRQFYQRAAERTSDLGIRQLLLDLAEAEKGHIAMAEKLTEEHLTDNALHEEDEARRRLFVLQVVQPGLAGLMDGSVSTLAPLFAAAFATHNRHHDAFLVGIAASVGAGISMGFAEALSDDGTLTGRGHPLIRGVVCGLMTAIGGLGHTLPFLILDFHIATAVAIVVVIAELAAISYIRHRYMDTPWFSATVQVGLGGLLVFITGILIGKAAG